MKIVDIIRAKHFKSGAAAYRLALNDGKYFPLAKKIISTKNVALHKNLTTLKSDRADERRKLLLEYKLSDNYIKLKLIKQIHPRASKSGMTNNKLFHAIIKTSKDPSRFFIKKNNSPNIKTTVNVHVEKQTPPWKQHQRRTSETENTCGYFLPYHNQPDFITTVEGHVDTQTPLEHHQRRTSETENTRKYFSSFHDQPEVKTPVNVHVEAQTPGEHYKRRTFAAERKIRSILRHG